MSTAQPAPWSWSLIDQPVDVSSLILREWKHAGDSPIIAARPRKPRGGPLPPPTFLLKAGRDAIGERLYSLAAYHFHLPSAVVAWTTRSDVPEAAIRFEPDAWRPRRIAPEQEVATTEERAVTLRNSLDYFRHLALSSLLGEYDGAEFMVWQQLLFRIDAAATGWTLFSFYLSRMHPSALRGNAEPQEDLSPLMRTTIDHLREETPPGYQAYLGMVAEIGAWDELPVHLANDLRTCPAAGCQFLSPVAFPWELPSLPTLADAVEAYLRKSQRMLTALLS